MHILGAPKFTTVRTETRLALKVLSLGQFEGHFRNFRSIFQLIMS